MNVQLFEQRSFFCLITMCYRKHIAVNSACAEIFLFFAFGDSKSRRHFVTDCPDFFRRKRTICGLQCLILGKIFSSNFTGEGDKFFKKPQNSFAGSFLLSSGFECTF